jgi:cell division protein ZapA (FtsZ GTPase activity inhibitor)
MTQFDVFLAHNTQDKPEVRAIALALKQRNIKPWLDEEQIPPGRSFQDEIQQAIPLVKSAAIFIGSQELGRWQSWELKAFIAECVENKIPVIPVLLPGVSNLPEYLVFLKQLRWITFSNGVDDEAALDLLQWGITGEKPKSRVYLKQEQKPGGIVTQHSLQILKEVETLEKSESPNSEQRSQAVASSPIQINRNSPGRNTSLDIEQPQIEDFFKKINSVSNFQSSIAKPQQTGNKSKAEFVLTGSIDSINETKLRVIVEHLRKLANDLDITILKVEEGSIKIIFEGSPEGIKRLQELVKSGKLTELSDFPIEDFHLIAADFSVSGSVSGDINNVQGENNRQRVSNKTSKYNLQNSQFAGGLINADTVNAGQIGGNITNYNPEQKQNLAQAAADIQQLLNQLSQTYPTTTSSEKMTVVAKAVDEIESNPTLKARVIGALKAGGTEALKELIDNPLINILLASIEGWQEAE